MKLWSNYSTASLGDNRIYDFLIKNYFIETTNQKAFWKDISEAIEDIELLSHINQARNKQRQIIVAWLDLKNAFGEVGHQLMLKVLE